jgi:hypothetical protein
MGRHAKIGRPLSVSEPHLRLPAWDGVDRGAFLHLLNGDDVG